MFTREEKKAFNQLFWTSFGKYMQKHTPRSGRKLNWINYKTGVKDLYLRMSIDNKKATFSIEFQQKDPGIRSLFFDQFQELRVVFKDSMKHEFIWERNTTNYQGNTISRVYTEIIGVNKFKKNDWHIAFEFFEKHLVPFDEFWTEFKEIFITLQE